MKKIAILLATLIILSACLSSCGDSKVIQNKLCASEWEFNYDELQIEVYTFNSNGTYELTIDSVFFDTVEQTGTYTISDEKIELVRDGDSYKSELTYAYSNDTLTLTCRNKTVSK